MTDEADDTEDTPPLGAVCADCNAPLVDGQYMGRTLGDLDGVPVREWVCVRCWIAAPTGTLPTEEPR